MLTIRIVEISGDHAEEVRDAALRLQGKTNAVGPLVADASDTLEMLSREEIGRLLKAIKPEARRILEMVAQHPEGTPFDDVQSALGLTNGQALSGRTSSIGHAMRRFFPGRPEPVSRNWPQRRYEMDPRIAAVIQQFAGGHA